MCVIPGRGSVLLWQHCDTLCSSGFVDDVTFGHNGLCGVFSTGAEFLSVNALLSLGLDLSIEVSQDHF